MADITFTDGMICKEHKFDDGGTITKLSFKVDEFIAFLQKYNDNGWVNAIVAKSQQSGKMYGKLDTWKPKQQEQGNQQQAPQEQSNGYQAQPVNNTQAYSAQVDSVEEDSIPF